ncbi:permease of phosphate ABC transporter [Lacrimispora sp.]|uniref:permease of phosphate ABC transporter n=1 Tax=Lacrimispora sp. TaxID=2719234 RepID=UPI0028AEA790|nr:permease of phosphate ABC transporter [Lacrimispora sp.]
MNEICKCADAFVQKCSIKDFALLKICLCAVGIMVGLSIPEKKRKWPLMAAGFVFIFSYILIMAKFVKICMEER